MAAITLILLTDGPHIINDMGLTIEGLAGSTYNLVDQRAEDVSISEDLQTAVDNGAFLAIDPRDPAELITLTAAQTKLALANHNQIHWGIVGGRFADLDDPNNTLTQDDIITVGPGGNVAVAQPLSTLLAGTDNVEVIQDIVGDMVASESDITYDDVAGTLDLEDNFLRNTGDTLDSGTLSVASGASIAVGTGADLTIADAPVNPTDAANKAYVDSVASGLDAKESVQAATTSETGFTYADNGGFGDSLTATIAGVTVVDGVTLEDGDRVLVKDQTDATQNGIYTVSGADAGTATVFTRATDQDGTPASEVSAGNFTYVENGSANGSTGWVTQGDGQLALNTDNVDWVQFSGAGSYTGGVGINQVGTEFSLITTNVPAAGGSVETTDVLVIGDSSNGEATATTTFADVFSDLDVVSGITANGIVVRTAADTYESRSIAVNPAGALGGLVVSNPLGIAGNPTLGLDIQNTASNDGVDNTDLVLAYDITTGENRTYTISEIANAATSDTFKVWTGAGNTTGDANVTAVGGSDEVTIVGGAGVNVNFNAATQAVEYSITGNGISTSAGVAGTDELVIFDPTTGAPTVTSVADFVDALDLAATLSASTVAGQEGIVIDNTDPSLPEVGLDINNLTSSAVELDATDELAVFDGTNNVSVTGQQVADGVATILGLPTFTTSTINGQEIVTVPDATRAGKQLSVDSNTFMWSENALNNNDWVQIAGASDADSGYIMPLDGTIVMATAHCENAQNATTINIYNGASTTTVGAAGSFTASANAQFVNTTLNIDFAQGDRIRLRNVGGKINDTVISVYVKWRA